MILKTVIRKISQKIVAIGSPKEKSRHFSRCIEFIGFNGIEGDILEFGVSRGDSLIQLDKIARRVLRNEQQMKYRIFGFDSFEGLPEPKGIDINVTKSTMQFCKVRYKCTKEDALLMLKTHKADVDNIQLIEGWYDEVLTPELRQHLQIHKASFINVDCDFYESAIVVLKWCKPLVDRGAVINFDDWFCYEGRPDRGAQRAFQEFLESNPDMTATPFSTESWHGKAFIINKTHERGTDK